MSYKLNRFLEKIGIRLHRKVQSVNKSLQEEEGQIKFFDTQKSAIGALAIQEGYKYIVLRHEMEANAAMQKLGDVNLPEKEIKYQQGRYNTSVKFLAFLDNITSP